MILIHGDILGSILSLSSISFIRSSTTGLKEWGGGGGFEMVIFF